MALMTAARFEPHDVEPTTITDPAEPGPSRPYTVDDLARIQDPLHRYEVIRGVLVVTPAPGTSHQDAVGQLFLRLQAACPKDLKVMVAPYGVRFTRDTELQPDVLVARREDFTAQYLAVAPLLAVEVLSPSTADIDRTLKRAIYAAHGVQSYWIVDPRLDKPSVHVLELDGDHYREIAHVETTDEVDVTLPFPLRFTPADLVDV